MTRYMSDWTPPASVADHVGQPLSTDLDFFAPPPAEIGDILSAQSNLKIGQKEKSLTTKLAYALGGGVFVCVVIMILGPFMRFYDPKNLPILLPVLFVVGAAIGFFIAVGSYKCSYVGKQGVARFDFSKDPQKTPKGGILLFRDAAELRTKQTKHYTNGIYEKTTYDYKWTDGKGQQIYYLWGSYQNKDGNPSSEDKFHLALASEAAWSAFLLDDARKELERNGSVRFNLKKDDCLIVSPGKLELCLNGQSLLCPTEEIDKMEINKGVITIRRKDAKSGFLGIGASGTFKFDYEDLANAKFCLALLDELVGVEVS